MAPSDTPPNPPPEPRPGFPTSPPVGPRRDLGQAADPAAPYEGWNAPVGPPVGDTGRPPGAGMPPLGPDVRPPVAGDDGRRRTFIILGVIAVMALLIGSIGYAVLRDGDEGQVAQRETTTTIDPTTTVTTEPEDSSTSSTSTTAPPVDEAELIALVRELQAYVEEARQLTFTRDVTVELLEGQEFEDRLLADFDEGRDDLDDAEVFYRALALLTSDEPLADQLRHLYAQGVLGFYDTETDELVVRGSALTPYIRQVIVHELVHALDDQHFELYRPDHDDRDDEVPSTFAAVVEGNARRVAQRWLDEQTEEFQQEVAAEEEAFGESADVDDVPYTLLFELGAPYQFGELFVNHIVSAQGEPAVDEALTTPPETSEQILFPEVYDQRQPAVPVPTPAPDGEPVDSGVLGALLLFGLLTDPESGIDPIVATRAAQGWGGDRYVTWTDGDANCVRIDLVGDTERDTDEISDALGEWTERRGVGAVSEVDGRVRVESCVVFSAGPESQT